MARVVVFALPAALSAARELSAVAPASSKIVARDYSKFAAVAGRADQLEEASPSVRLLVTDAASLTGAESAALTAIQADYVSATAYQLATDDDSDVNYIASAAQLVDTAIRVANSNRAPTVANALVNQNGTELAALTPYAFAANSFADADGASDTLTYSALLSSGAALPAWLTFTAATRTFSGTPADGSAAVFTIRVKATDKAKAFVTADFTLTVVNN